MENSSEPEALTLIQPAKPRKAVVVVGKMGHGKSAFVRMLAKNKS